MNPEDEKTINVLDLVSDGDVESPEEVNNSESKLKVLASHEEFASEVIDDDSPFPEVRAAVPSTSEHPSCLGTRVDVNHCRVCDEYVVLAPLTNFHHHVFRDLHLGIPYRKSLGKVCAMLEDFRS